jgi:hypothetical protein
VAFNPYNVDVTPDGRYALVSCTGAGTNQGDTVATIEATGPHPHVVELMTPGNGTEGLGGGARRQMGGDAAAARLRQ